MVGRGGLLDTAWVAIALLLPPDDRRGRSWADNRKVISGILWKSRTGVPCRNGMGRGRRATTASRAGIGRAVSIEIT